MNYFGIDRKRNAAGYVGGYKSPITKKVIVDVVVENGDEITDLLVRTWRFSTELVSTVASKLNLHWYEHPDIRDVLVVTGTRNKLATFTSMLPGWSK